MLLRKFFISSLSKAASRHLEAPLLKPKKKCLSLKRTFDFDIPRASFFWGKKKAAQEEEPPKPQTIEEEIEKMGSLKYLVENIKEENRKLPPLLPPKDPADADKLTVVMEIDEVLLYTFSPDEHEGYLSAPQR